MIDEADRRLRDWAGTVLMATDFSLAPPGQEEKGAGVNFYLLELADRPPARGTSRSPLQLQLRYLVTTRAEEPEEAHRLLGELVFAAMDNSDFEVDLSPLPATVWAAFGIAPRPSFVLCVPLRRERPEPETKIVLKPLVVQAVPVTSLHGVILGPGDVPLAGARVELPTLRLYNDTDHKGRFYFSNVPGQALPKRLLVKARGHEMSLVVDRATSSSDPLVVHFDLFNQEEK